jgi:hypothetical protein
VIRREACYCKVKRYECEHSEREKNIPGLLTLSYVVIYVIMLYASEERWMMFMLAQTFNLEYAFIVLERCG